MNSKFKIEFFPFHLPCLPKANFGADYINHVIPRLVEHKAKGIYRLSNNLADGDVLLSNGY